MNIQSWIQASGYLVYLSLKNIWLCSLFVHLDSRKNTSTLSFFHIYWFLLCMEMALEDLHIYQKSFSNSNTYTYVCMYAQKSFSSAHFPTFTLHQTKAWKLSTFYAYIECTSMHRMKNLCWKAIQYSNKGFYLFEATQNIPKKEIYLRLGYVNFFLHCGKIIIIIIQKCSFIMKLKLMLE